MIVRASETEAICGAGRRLNRRQRAGDRGLARLNGRSAAEAESSVCPNQDATTVQIGEKVARSSPPTPANACRCVLAPIHQAGEHGRQRPRGPG
jgi:hypothetical protein